MAAVFDFRFFLLHLQTLQIIKHFKMKKNSATLHLCATMMSSEAG
jgi:hypothetical protein